MLGKGGDPADEFPALFRGMFFQGDVHEKDDKAADPCRVENGAIVIDDAGGLQPPQPLMYGGGRDVYPDREAFRGLGAFILLGAAFLPFVFTCTLPLYVLLHRGILVTGLLLFPYSIGSALVSKFALPVLFRRLGVVQTGILAVCFLRVRSRAVPYQSLS